MLLEEKKIMSMVVMMNGMFKILVEEKMFFFSKVKCKLCVRNEKL